MKTAIHNKEKLFSLLGITEQQYLKCIKRWGRNFSIGCSYEVEEMAEHLITLDEYWHWWKRQADIRDEVFCREFADYAGTGNESNLMDMWADAHDYKTITGAPPRHITTKALNLLKEQVKKQDELFERIETILKGI